MGTIKNKVFHIILIILIFLLLLKLSDYILNVEPFYNLPDYANHNYWDLNQVGKIANDCYELNDKDCIKYSNCGLCIKDDKLKCIPGDVQGPLFKEDCEGWIYTDYNDRYIFGEKVTTMTPPWNKFYSEYEIRYPSPKSRATL